MSTDKTAFLVLNYNTYEKSRRCVYSCLEQENVNKTVFIVDNHSSDDSLNKLKKEFGNKVEYIVFDDNYGYAGGNNRAVSLVRTKGFKYSFILNSDTELVGKSLCEHLLVGFDRCNGCAVVAPKIYNVTSNGLILNGNDSLYLRALIKTKIVPFKKIDIDGFSAIPEAQGSALIVDNDIFCEVGGFPEEYFMYNEESTFAKKILWSNHVILWNDAKDEFIKHHHDKKNNVASWRVYLMGRNKAIEYYVYRKKSPFIWFAIFHGFLLYSKHKNIFNNYKAYNAGVKTARKLIKKNASKSIMIEDARSVVQKAFS